MKVLLVYNPCAGHGRARRSLTEIEGLARELGLKVETFRARRITVVNEHPKTLSPDGELIGETPAEVECLHRALEVFC